MPNSRTNTVCRQRRGITSMWFAALLTVLVAIVAFALDIGYLNVARTQLQRAADAGALAGAHALRGGPAPAKLAAENFAESNTVAGVPVTLVPGDDVELGSWDETSRVFTALTGSAENDADAVRVSCLRSAARGEEISLFFAPVIGTSSSEVAASATAVIRRSPCGRIFGKDYVRMVDGNTDSWNSDLGTYASQTPDTEGNICSNGWIDVGSGAIVNGNARPGPGHNVTIGSTGSVTGSTLELGKPIEMPPVDYGDADVFNDNNNIPAQFFNGFGNVDVSSGDVLTLPAGTYYIDGDLKVSGLGRIDVTGFATIYVVGDVDITGSGLVNTTGIPTNLRVLTMGATAKFSGSAALHADIYGPDTAMTFAGNGGLYGAIVGKSIDMNGNTAIHADDALPITNYAIVNVMLVD